MSSKAEELMSVNSESEGLVIDSNLLCVSEDELDEVASDT